MVNVNELDDSHGIYDAKPWGKYILQFDLNKMKSEGRSSPQQSDVINVYYVNGDGAILVSEESSLGVVSGIFRKIDEKLNPPLDNAESDGMLR